VNVRAALRGLGELLVTAGVVVLLFVAYQLFWTNLQADRAQAKVTDRIENGWDKPGAYDPAAPTLPGGKPQSLPGVGDGFAVMWIPRLGSSWHKPVVQGVALSDLHRGLGHYQETAMPGQLGNFSVAGHRATNGEPFRSLDRMKVGDSIVVETKSTWLVYVVDKTFKVLPDGVWVIDPVPGKPVSTTPTQKLITLTTCDPRWGHTRRLIVSGHLVSVRPKSAGRPAVLAAGKA
jgi:sortase A